MRVFAIAMMLASAAACAPPAQTSAQADAPMPIETAAPAQAPAEVLAAVQAQDAAFVVTDSVQDNTTGAQTYKLKGTGAQGVTTYSVMHFNEGWRVVEVRREMAWADAPRAVRDVVANSAQAMVPDRVEEVYQPGAEGVTYDLYNGAAVALTVRDLGDGQAAIMPAPH